MRRRAGFYIDRRHGRVGRALTFDSQPDEMFGGYARFQDARGTIGFLGRERRIAISARYDVAYPFNGCRAVVCVECHPLRWSKDAPEEAACIGDAFLIDEAGTRLQAVHGPSWERCSETQG